MQAHQKIDKATLDAAFDAAAKQLLSEIEAEFADAPEIVRQFLEEAAKGPEAINQLARFKWKPVEIREFIESPSYMNRGGKVYPLIMRELEELNNGSYVECVLTGGIGSGKTTAALYTQAYQLYLLSCYRNPHEVFDLDDASEIMIIFQSLNESLATDVDYQRFRSMLDAAPYFKDRFPFDRGYQSAMKFPNRIVVKPISGQDTGAIGQNVIGGIIDEIDFMAVVENSRVKRDGSVYDQAVENYNSIARRRESRFMQKGSLPGMLCLVSSKNYPGGMTDRKQAEARDNKRIFVYDKRVYDVVPERFGPERFRVFVGDETRKPRLIADDEVVPDEDEAIVAHVPEEYRIQFENDLIKSIRDIAGHSTQTVSPFMFNTDAVAACFGKLQPICSRPDVDFVRTRPDIYPKRIININEPRFAHVDLAVTKDCAGIAIGHVPGFKHMNRGEYQETLPLINYDLILEVRPPRGGEIPFEEIRSFLYNLRDKLNLPIKWVSFDQFQSTDMRQILDKNGFITGQFSLDTDTGGYDLLKQAFYDGRVSAPEHRKALKELLTLEYNAKKQKVDHRPQGSKDIADAMAGVAYGLVMRREIWVRHNIPLTRMPKSLEKIGKRSVEAKERTYANAMDRIRAARGVMPLDRDREDDIAV